ncbi:hypothetical protein SEA_FINKLE_11 [Gordonia phage Finkle]|uniref:Uncharacterized protein n=1 Tax=Gordonia phage Finkle TaxID=2926099 RepID=A0A9E7SXH5_9CAUD|nr:hypothetical protein QEH33_gp11 [Gordonia phage Finkle]UTN92930.1 hypothetical protein SEA_FINKLE_11 [Gordonia phage Finkle]
MAVIHHPKKGFAGTLVVGARRYEFDDGCAVSDLSARDRVYLMTYGFAVEDPVEEEPVAIVGVVVDDSDEPGEGIQIGDVEYAPDAEDLPAD